MAEIAGYKSSMVGKSEKLELMAPAGNFESLPAVLDNGADSVYFGVEQLNMRARVSLNFTIEDLINSLYRQ